MRIGSGGQLFHTAFSNNPNTVLAGDGQFREINSLSIDMGWKRGAQTIYMEEGWRVGIGLSNPTEALDVLGNGRFSGNVQAKNINTETLNSERATFDSLYAPRVSAAEVKSDIFRTNSISIDGVNNKITSESGEIDFGNSTIRATSLITSRIQIERETILDSMKVNKYLRVGNFSLHLSSNAVGATSENSIYSTNGPLLLQCNAQSKQNTIINANNNGYVGIGTMNPKQNLHISGITSGIAIVPIDPNDPIVDNPLSAVIRLEDESRDFNYAGFENRKSYWDISSSAVQKGLFFSTNKGLTNGSSTTVMQLSENGQVVIGPTNICKNWESIRLIVDGHILLTDGPNEETRSLFWGYKCKPEWGIEYEHNEGGLNFWNPYTSSSGQVNYRLFLQNGTGNIGIGTSKPEYKLDVCGEIRAKEVYVSTDWCDYKFESDYKIMPWSDKKSYIETNKRLPDIDPASIIESKGLSVARNMRGMVSNIEDNTLDIISLYEQNVELKEQVVRLEERLKKLERMILESNKIEK